MFQNGVRQSAVTSNCYQKQVASTASSRWAEYAAVNTTEKSPVCVELPEFQPIFSLELQAGKYSAGVHHAEPVADFEGRCLT